ncbi:MAG TPA: UDP-N-acetylglucosamine 2-epimerase (non-hydrolyzing) [Prolixibacteraceae bacterium]|nr:UDP-N-acetylglucosamine 2-epimerase (non-hydrolyzing) [Prolixibacteraceae bacterium]
MPKAGLKKIKTKSSASCRKVAVVLGTRPELVKMLPVMDALDKANIETILIHSGQHYDDLMSEVFFRDMGIRKPDFSLGVGSGSGAWQVAECMSRLEKILEKSKPDTVLVQGDTNTVLAGAITGARMGLKVGHVEAGLRSYDWRMPEEHNRKVADHISNLLFAPTKESERILKSEHVWGEIFVTGNTVLDSCEKFAPIALRKRRILKKLEHDDFILATTHRAENVDNPAVLKGLVKILENAPLPVVFPIHPRTVNRLRECKLYGRLAGSGNVQLLDPVGYLDFLSLMMKSRFIFTDSGGIQEEATSPSVRKRVLVFRDSTERPEAVKAGYAHVVGTDPAKVLAAMKQEAARKRAVRAGSPYGDGKAGEKIVRILQDTF